MLFKSFIKALFLSSQIKKEEVRMSERDIKVQAIINPISGVGSKRKIPKMIEGICSKKELVR